MERDKGGFQRCVFIACLNVKKGKWVIVAKDGKFTGQDAEDRFNGGRIGLAPYSALILRSL